MLQAPSLCSSSGVPVQIDEGDEDEEEDEKKAEKKAEKKLEDDERKPIMDHRQPELGKVEEEEEEQVEAWDSKLTFILATIG